MNNTAAKTIRIAVISDTHGHVNYTRAGVRMIEPFEVAAVLHCGDVGSASVVDLFAAWPTHFVHGNCDDPVALGEAVQAAGQTYHAAFGEMELAGARIALIHSDDERRFRAVCSSGDYDLVCYGHTHRAKQERRGKTLILNPGAMYRAEPHSFAIVELPVVEATIVPVSAS